jgi:hypothetical protein
MVEVCAAGVGFTYRIKEYLHRFSKDFEHEIGSVEVVEIMEISYLFLWDNPLYFSTI